MAERPSKVTLLTATLSFLLAGVAIFRPAWLVPREGVFCLTLDHDSGGCERGAFRRKEGFLFETDYFGLRYRGSWADWSEGMLLLYGAYEKPVLYFMKEYLDGLGGGARKITLDVGAYHGTHTLFLSLHSDKVHAFEPNPQSFGHLARNVEVNRLENVVLHQTGLGESEGELTFHDGGGTRESGTLWASFVADYSPKHDITMRARVARGDDLLPAEDSGSVSLVKIDVEGFERPVLAGLRTTLASARPVIVMEVSRENSLAFRSDEDLLGALPERYRLFRFQGEIYTPDGRYSLVPFSFSSIDPAPFQPEVVAIPEEKMGSVRLTGGTSS